MRERAFSRTRLCLVSISAFAVRRDIEGRHQRSVPDIEEARHAQVHGHREGKSRV